MKIDGILWDYDGTIVNSVPKNIHITKQIISQVAPRLSGRNLPEYLQSEESYHIANHQSKNWQDLYLNYYGMTESEMAEAGTLWTQYQLTNTTPVNLFPEIKQTISRINLPQGICSQNSSENITQVLKLNELNHKVQAIIGYDDIPNNAQKPNPLGGIKCLKKLFENNKYNAIAYIGDHEGDVEFARNIETKLNGEVKIIAMIVKYSGANTTDWKFKPDIEINNPIKLLEIIGNYR